MNRTPFLKAAFLAALAAGLAAGLPDQAGALPAWPQQGPISRDTETAQRGAIATRMPGAAGGEAMAMAAQGEQVPRPRHHMGRPARYEQRPPAEREAVETISGPGFSGRKPAGGQWKVSIGQSYLAFTTDTPAAVAMAARGQTFLLVVTLASPAFALDIGADRFPRAFEEETRENIPDRVRLVSIAATRRGDPGDYCADYEVTTEERDDPEIPGVVLEIRTRGFVCLDESSAFVVKAFYSERRPRGTPTMVDASLREEAEAFLKSLIVNPKRER
jgi:hypothetical protein